MLFITLLVTVLFLIIDDQYTNEQYRNILYLLRGIWYTYLRRSCPGQTWSRARAYYWLAIRVHNNMYNTYT